MFTTWTSENLEIKRELTTRWERELMTGPVSGGNETRYFRYKRVREMRFNYVGLTRQAAYCCAADMRNRFRRKQIQQSWSDDGAGHIAWVWPIGTSLNDLSYTIVEAAEVMEPTLTKGEMWQVEVDVREELFYNHTPWKNSEGIDPESYRFTAFEMDPDGEYGEFAGGKGGVPGADFWYPSALVSNAADRLELYPPTGWMTYRGNDAVEVRLRNSTGIASDKLWGQFYADGRWLDGAQLSRGVLAWPVTASASRPTMLRVYFPGDESHGYIESNSVLIGG
jgi:hypothetical protein